VREFPVMFSSICGLAKVNYIVNYCRHYWHIVLIDHNDEVLEARFKFHVLSNIYMLDIWVMIDGHQYFLSV
jgi:hypothetical protein